VTSLLPLLPDNPRLPAAEALAGGPAAAPLPGPGASDFAGLVEAFAAPPSLAPTAVTAGSTPQPEDSARQEVFAADPEAASLPPATTLAAWSSGKNLPEPGALLPPALPQAPTPGAAVPGAAASQPPRPAFVAASDAAVEPDGEAPVAAAPAAPPGNAPRPARRHHLDVPSLDRPAPALPAETVAARPPADEGKPAAQPGEAAECAEPQAGAPEPAIAPQPLLVTLPYAPVLASDAVSAPPPPPAPSPVPVQASTAAAVLPAPAAPLPPAAQPLAGASSAPAEPAADAARLALAAAPAARAPSLARSQPPGLADTVAVPTQAAEPAPASTPTSAPAADALPETAPSLATTPQPASPAPVQTPPTSPLPERPADPRASPPAAQLESAIAQVGDIREALRSARPAMTLQHAEFGAVSLRLEPAAPDQWRAVLASRDPGFVPAVHAALDARAVLAAGEASSASFGGHSGAHQNGTADQRYGSTPNGGQGSPQPYLGQSGSRDGEAAPDHRRPSTAAALAARGDSAAEDAAASTPGSGGLFA
jgi:hypothetical protein